MAHIGDKIPYTPYKVYKNIEKLFKYRNLELDKNSKSYTEQEFIKNIQYAEYVILVTNDSKEKDRRYTNDTLPINKTRPVKTVFIILNEDSSFIETSSKFVNLLNAVPGYNDDNRNFNLDILIISREIVGAHIEKKMKDLITDGDEKNGFVKIHSYPYKYFTSVIPENALVPPHRILSKEEEKKVLESIFSKKVDLPKITKHGSVGVWFGLEVGDVVEVKLPSENTGVEIKYLTTRP